MMRLATAHIAFLVLLLTGCTPKKPVADAQMAPPPSWVQSRPVSSMYYIGIGVAQKTGNPNFQRSARESALSDLASEIKVNVSTNSLLYTLEREYRFEQEFRETIKVTSDLDLEDFELVDTWEDQNSYWAYYRLNRQIYADKQQEKRETAQNLALDFYTKGRSAENSGQFRTAVDSYMRGLQALEQFWGENNAIDFQGSTLQLDNALYTSVRDLLAHVRLKLDGELKLTFQNDFKIQAKVQATDGRNNHPLEGLPIKYEYFGQFGRFRGTAMSNADGRFEIPIFEADRQRNSNTLLTEVDKDLLFEPFHTDRFMRKLAESMPVNSLQSQIVIVAPLVHLDSEELNLGKAMNTSPLSAAIKTSLGRRNIQFTDQPDDADLVMTIRADTRKGGSDRGFFTTQLDIDIAVKNNSSGQRVYNISRSDLRGVDLDHERAGLKAYQNLTRNIESEIMRRLVSDLF